MRPRRPRRRPLGHRPRILKHLARMKQDGSIDWSTIDLRTLLEHQERQKQKRLDTLKLEIATAPVGPKLLSELSSLGLDAPEVLRHHPGEKVSRKLDSLWQMLLIFEQAHRDLAEKLNAFEVFSRTDEMHLPSGKAQLAAIEIAVNKELMSFSAAAGALVQFCRRLKDDELPNITEARAAHFDAQEHEFVMALRNGIVHQELPNVSWQIDYGGPQHRTTDFVISSVSLSQLGLHSTARAYASRHSAGVRVKQLVDSYAQRVRAFYEWFKKACDAAEPATLKDYRRVVRACKAQSLRTGYRFLVSQFLARKVDPYEHLEKHLLPHQVEAALRLPMRSKQQVDFIIEAVDQHGACDDELRSMVYRLFCVATPSPA